MNPTYKGIRNLSIVATLAAAMLPSCEDDLGHHGDRLTNSVTFAVNLPAQWTSRTTADPSAPDTHCTAVSRTESSVDGATPLYIHTLEADRPAPAVSGAKTSRGTLLNDKTNAEKYYSEFSLSGICYVGSYPADEDDNKYRASDYALNLTYNFNDGTSSSDADKLIWPANGKVRFFAFAPTKLFSESDGRLTLPANTTGSPKITYTVPAKVEDQLDLLTAQTDQTSTPSTNGIRIEFKHALTAIRIATAADMLAGTIHSVTISGVYGTATHIPGSDQWIDHTNSTNTSYTISPEIKLEKKENSSDIAHTTGGTTISGTDKDNLTFLLIPQTCPDDAKLTIEFTDELTNTKRTITGSLKGHQWQAGKIITYQISPSSIHITPVVEIEQLGSYNTDNTTSTDDGKIDNPYYNTDIFHSTEETKFIPFSGAIRNLRLNAYIKVTQEGADEKKVAKPFRILYSTDNSTWETAKWEPNIADETDDWTELKPASADEKFDGSIIVASQSTFAEGQSFSTSYCGSISNPHNLGEDETANCYVINSPGYYKFPLVYGNAIKNGATNEEAYKIVRTGTAGVDYDPGMRYYVDHNNNEITQPYIYKQESVGTLKDAFILWQDSPGLLDMVTLSKDSKNIEFRVSKNTIAQGNAVIALRNDKNEIVWSWHIWVTDNKNWSKGIETTGADNKEYTLTSSVLGYCDARKAEPARDMWLKFEFDLKDFEQNKLSVTKISNCELKFKQQEIKASIAGDNTYYQWGRKDAMVPGIYASNSGERYYTYTNSNGDKGEFTLHNKPVFDFNEDYIFTCSNSKNGINMGTAIQNPHHFALGEGTYRTHWHNHPKGISYLANDTTITVTKTDGKTESKTIASTMYNAWDSKSQHVGITHSNSIYNSGVAKSKTIYDPCPAGYQVPPANAFSGILHYSQPTTNADGNTVDIGYFKDGRNKDGKPFNTINWDNTSRTWTFRSQGSTDNPTGAGEQVTLHATGLRDMNLNSDNLKIRPTTLPPTWAAFSMITFIPSSTIFSGAQVLIFFIDNRTQGETINNHATYCGSCEGSNNSYGFPIWPIEEIKE